MTKQEIKSLVAAKIAGQGTNVDAAGVLPELIEGITDMCASTQEVDDFEEFDASTAYSSGDIVRYNGRLYKFTSSHSGAWTGTDVTATSVMTLLKSNEVTVLSSDFTSMTVARYNAIAGAATLKNGGEVYVKTLLTSEITSAVLSAASSATKIDNIYIREAKFAVSGSTVSLDELDALALVYAGGSYKLVEVVE